jgi:hypothetical protein
LTCCAEFGDCPFSLSLSLMDRRTRGRVGSSKEARLRSEFGLDEVSCDRNLGWTRSAPTMRMTKGLFALCLGISGLNVDLWV